jgi:hypothetical protein
VRYRVADLLNPPAEWRQAFDLVVEIYTVQAMPAAVRQRATANVAGLVGPGGTLFVGAVARDEEDGSDEGPPWPMSRTEIEAFAAGELTVVRIENTHEVAGPRWVAEFRHPGAADHDSRRRDTD